MSKLAYFIATGFLLISMSPAVAQQLPQGQTTTWQPVKKPLDALLNDGWSIVSSTDVNGLILVKNGKWVQCTLVSLPTEGRRLEYSDQVASLCHALN